MICILCYNQSNSMATAQYHAHRRFLDPELGMPPFSPQETFGSYTSKAASFDSSTLIVFAALICALLCALGLSNIVRCALRCRDRHGFETPELQGTPRMVTTTTSALEKSLLNQIPVIVYGSGLNFPVIECPICLGEFIQGEKLRVLPKCKHGFHVMCIDKWLVSHSSCPLCRQALLDHPTILPETGQEVLMVVDSQ